MDFEIDYYHKNNKISILEKDIFKFPIFKNTINQYTWIFNKLEFVNGTLIIINGDKLIGKSLYFNILCGLYKPSTFPNNISFLKYNIAYKKENIIPKSCKIVNELIHDLKLSNNKYYYVISRLINLDNFENINIQELNIEQQQKLSFLITFLSKKDIYIFDYPENSINEKLRYSLLTFLKKIAITENINILFIENNENIINNILEKNGILYNIKNINNNNKNIYGSMQ